ncbi:MAG: hypothetical protein Q4C71_00675 [Microbacteriaceae bacterium]|nr:hypothetical protein [Microbacteriaceae bacterium]
MRNTKFSILQRSDLPQAPTLHGTGALSFSEERKLRAFLQGNRRHLHNRGNQRSYEFSESPDPNLPLPRPRRDESGRKMSLSYYPRTNRLAFMCGMAIAVIICLLSTTAPFLMGDAVPFPAKIGVSAGVSLFLLLLFLPLLSAVKKCGRAIAYDERHGAAGRLIGTPAFQERYGRAKPNFLGFFSSNQEV